MQLSTLVATINKEYVPGALQWWSKQEIDYWQRSNDELERLLETKDMDAVQAFIPQHLKTVRECLAVYKKNKPTQVKLTALDGFMMAGTDKLKQAESVEDKACIKCGSLDKVSIHRSETKDGYYFVCSLCMGHKS